MLKIHSLETFGTHDGPGIRLVVFMQGCNFNCAYCHNPDAINLKGGKNVSIKEILNILEEQKPYFTNGGGLTVSGGEPMLQAKELIKLFKKVKEKGFHTALDTNASIITKDVKELLNLADLAIIDLKHFDNQKHIELTGQSNENVLENIEYREKCKKPFYIRFVLVPNWTDQKDYIEKMALWLSKFKYLERVEILPYHNLGEYKYKQLGKEYKLRGITSPSNEDILEVKNIFKKYGKFKLF